MEISPEEVQSRIRQGRGPLLEWLPENAPVDSLAAALTAMANAQGGMLVIGVIGPTGAIVGVRDPLSAADRIVQAALSIEPRLIIPYPQVVRVTERPLVIAHIPRGMPHVYACDGRFLIRQDAENRPLSPRDLRRMFIARGELSFETEITPRTSLDDIDWEAARSYVGALSSLTIAANTVENTLLRRGCLSDSDGKLRPTNAGMLLFGTDPSRFLRGAEITAARFQGDSMTDRFIKEDITGRLPSQLMRAESFLQDNLRKDVQLGRDMARSETHEVPIEAVRELLVNAVAHRDYSIEGDGIHVNLYHNRIEVVSPGGLPGPITVDNMKVERFSRNPAIVQVLADMRFIERLGYGVDRVCSLMDERNLRAPEFYDSPASFRATLYNERLQATDELLPQDVVHERYAGMALNPRQEAALQLLHGGSTRITNKDLQALYPDVHAETIRRDLADLVSRNTLRKLGEKRGSYYVLRAD